MTKKQRINRLFTTNIGTKFSSYNMHSLFGSSFRSRVSDINADPTSTIRIRNASRNGESWYWSEKLSFNAGVQSQAADVKAAELVAV